MRRAAIVRSLVSRVLPTLLVVAMIGLQGCASNDPLAPGAGTSALPAGLAFSLIPSPTITTNTNVWTTLAPMPTPRTGVATEVVSSLIYVMGGWDGTAATNKVEAYNRTTDAWITKASLPAARYDGNGAAETGGRFYVPGGRSPLGAPTANLYVFNPGTNTWTSVKPMPGPGACGTTLALVAKLYVSVGCDATPGYKNSYYVYTKANNSWVVTQPSPTAHAYGAAGQVSNKSLGLVGGYDSTGHVTNVFEAYDTLTKTWTTLAPMPTPRAKMYGRAVSGLFYVIGGVNDEGTTLDVVEVYNPLTDSWSAQAPLPTPRSGLGVMVLGHDDPNVQALGGTDASGNVVGTNEMLAPGNLWAPRASMPVAVTRFATGSIGKNTYVAGGVAVSGAINTLRLYNGVSWASKAVLPQARYDGNGLEPINNLLYLAGGWSPTTGLPTKTLYAYNSTANSWATKAAMPVASGCGATGAIGGKLYVATGCDGVNYRTLLTMFDPALNKWTPMAPSAQAHVFPDFRRLQREAVHRRRPRFERRGHWHPRDLRSDD